ncbi:myeloblastin-like [Armigeres subalbatus]|uniref:myeloblastin-like n=1 Tax=Armigeres subalbatus TaxID=124917 RepID=UPI002ED62F99
MKSAVTITLALLIASSSSSVISRIVGGTNAPTESYPYMVSIRLTSLETTGFGDGFYCQGVLVSPKAILTSGECVLNGSGLRFPEELSLVLGTTSRVNASGATGVQAERIWITQDGHLAILKLVQEVLDLRAVILNEFQQDVGKQCILTGWGANSTEDKPVDRLQEVYVRIVDEKCSDSMICTSTGKENVGVCSWDTGMPLLCDGSLSGVLFGKPDKCGIEVATFVSVRTHWEWIRSQIAAANDANYRVLTTSMLILCYLMAVELNITK